MKHTLSLLALLSVLAVSALAHQVTSVRITESFCYQPAPVLAFSLTPQANLLSTASLAQPDEPILWVNLDSLPRQIARFCERTQDGAPTLFQLDRLLRPVQVLFQLASDGLTLRRDQHQHMALQVGRSVVSHLPQANAVWYVRCQIAW